MIWVSPDGATRRVIQYRILIYHKGCMYNILHKQKNSLIQLFISGHSYMLLSLILLCAYSRQLIPYVTTPRRYDIFTLLHSVLTPQALQKRQQVLPQGAWSSCDRCPRWTALGDQSLAAPLPPLWSWWHGCGVENRAATAVHRPSPSLACLCATDRQQFAQCTAHSLGALSKNTSSRQSGSWAQHTHYPHVWHSCAHTACYVRC